MDSTKQKSIEKKAKEISKVSEGFQLIHAAYASQAIIKEAFIECLKTKYEDLSERIIKKMLAHTDYEAELKEKEQLEFLLQQKCFHIEVAYIETHSEDAARVIKTETAFVINLSKDLKEKIFTESGDYNYNVIQKIRKLMAHEIGHLVLHTNDLLNIEGTQGSKLITDSEKEEEADFFGEQLLSLRKDRNKKIHLDGGAHINY